MANISLICFSSLLNGLHDAVYYSDVHLYSYGDGVHTVMYAHVHYYVTGVCQAMHEIVLTLIPQTSKHRHW